MRLIPAVLYLLFILPSCNQVSEKTLPVVAPKTQEAVVKHKKQVAIITPVPEKMHPLARKFMQEKFYFNLTNQTSPFGNSDGLEAYSGFHDWRLTHKDDEAGDFINDAVNNTGYPKFDLNDTGFDKLKKYIDAREFGSRFISGIDAAIIATSFGQLYLEGTIDKSLLETSRISIKRQLLPELLAFWGEPYQAERKAMLDKMLTTLDHVQ